MSNIIISEENKVNMIKGFKYNNLLKIGFLNEKKEELLESYKKHYDVVIIGDGNFLFVNKILKEIINN